MAKIQVAVAPEGTETVTPIFQAGVWAVHKTTRDSASNKEWTTTHVPTGRAILQGLSLQVAVALAQKLFNVAPKLLEGSKLREVVTREMFPPEALQIFEAAEAELHPATVEDILGEA